MVDQTTPPAPSAAPQGPAADPMAPIRALDRPTQLVVGAGVAVAVIAVIGAVVESWFFDWTGLILLAAGLVPAAVAWLTAEGRTARPMPVAPRDLALGGAAIAAVISVLSLLEILFDLDDLGDYGGVIGLVAAVLIAIAGVALYVVTTQRWFGGLAEPWSRVVRSSLPARLVVIGAAVTVVGWIGNVTFGVWYLEPGVIVLASMLIAAAIARAADDPAGGITNQLAAGVVAAVLIAISAVIAIQHTSSFAGEGLGLDDWIPQLAYVGGVAIAAVGVVLWLISLNADRTAQAGGPA
jgi:hypothetical protein